MTIYATGEKAEHIDWLLKVLKEEENKGLCIVHDYGDQPYGSRKIGIRPYDTDKIVHR